MSDKNNEEDIREILEIIEALNPFMESSPSGRRADSKYEIADIYVVSGDEIVTVIRHRKIFLKSSNEGVIVKDGRPVKKIGKSWVYTL